MRAKCKVWAPHDSNNKEQCFYIKEYEQDSYKQKICPYKL
jgi:hypothetical protein